MAQWERWYPEDYARVVRLARAGHRWRNIGKSLNRPLEHCFAAWQRTATLEDRLARRDALHARGRTCGRPLKIPIIASV